MIVKVIGRCISPVLYCLDLFQPIMILLARIWVAQVFFFSGLVKLQAFQATILMFATTYHVPFLSPSTAAFLATFAELALPVLLAVGFGGRISILLFFIFNIYAAISYPFLWTSEGYMGLTQHIMWALTLGLLMCLGPGKISVDYLLRKLHGHHLIWERHIHLTR